MAIGRITGPMLNSNLDRQGVNLAIDANLVYFDVNNRYVGVNNSAPAYAIDSPGSARLANLTIIGNTITSNTGKINLGSISNLVLTGGGAYNVITTDGAGTVTYLDVNAIPGISGINSNSGAYQTWANANIGSIFNRTGSLEANVGAYEIYANANIGSIFNRTGSLEANVGAYEIYANANIGSIYNRTGALESNIGAFEIYSNANVGSIYDRVGSLEANVGAYEIYANANIGSIFNRTGSLESNVGAYQIYANANIGTLYLGNISTNANLGAYQVYANANIGSIFNRTGSLEANVGAYEIYANANIGSIFNRTGSLEANVGAYHIWANANVSSLQTQIFASNANIGAFQTYSNNRIQTLEANVGAFETYTNVAVGSITTGANANTAAYLNTFTGNISAGNVNTPYMHGNVIGTFGAFTSNVDVGSFTVAGISTFTGNLNAGNIILTGNINATVGAVASSNGVFYGNAAGFGALYTGITSGFVVQPQTIIQSSSNFNGYAQINMQNINAGAQASSDFVATANNGNADDTYIDMGIASSAYNYPGFGIINPNDGYLLVQGNTTTGGGNLVLTSGKNDIVFAPGGSNANNEFGRITASNVFVVKSTVAATSYSTGAVQVAGGASIVGNLYVAGDIVGNISSPSSTVGNISSNTIAVFGNVTAGNVNSTFYGNLNTGYISGNVDMTGNLFVQGPILSIPVGNLVQRPGNAPGGSMRFNSSTSSVEFYNGNQWISVLNGVTDQTIVGDGSTDTFALNQSVAGVNSILVSINGVVQQPTVAYQVSNGNITFSEIPQVTDTVDIRFLSVAVEYNLTQLANFTGDINISGNIIPAANVIYHLGNVTNQWGSIYSSGTITAANVKIQNSGFVQYAVYTSSALTAIAGQLGWTAAVSNSSPAGRLAFWDGTNSRWSYVSDNSAV